MKVGNEDKNKPIENRHGFNNPSEISSLIYFVCIDKTNPFKIKKGSSMGRIRKLISSKNGTESRTLFWEI